MNKILRAVPQILIAVMLLLPLTGFAAHTSWHIVDPDDPQGGLYTGDPQGGLTTTEEEDTSSEAAEFVKLKNPLAGTVDSIPELIREILDIIVLIGVPIVAIMIIVSGLRLVLAQGKPEELSKARQGLLWTIVGAAIVLGAYAISEAIGSTVGELVAFITMLYV